MDSNRVKWNRNTVNPLGKEASDPEEMFQSLVLSKAFGSNTVNRQYCCSDNEPIVSIVGNPSANARGGES